MNISITKREVGFLVGGLALGAVAALLVRDPSVVVDAIKIIGGVIVAVVLVVFLILKV